MRRLRHMLPVLLLAAAVPGFHQAVSAAGCAYMLTQAITTAYYTIVSLGLCLLMGYGGQISLGHGAFLAIGGYTSAILTTRPLPALAAPWDRLAAGAGLLTERVDLFGARIVTVSPWAAFAAGLLLAAAAALAIGIPALRLRGHYLSMATLGFGLIVYRVALGSAFTGAADGISGVPPWRIGDWISICGRKPDRVANYYLAWTLVLAVFLMLLNLVRSRPGRALRALHDSETAAAAMGIDTAAAKRQAFVISAVLAAAAGSMLAHSSGGITPSEASAMRSIRYVALVAVGGMANLGGTLVAAALLTFLSLRDAFGTYDDAVFGAILIAVVALAPEGPQGLAAAGRDLLAARRGGGRRHGPA